MRRKLLEILRCPLCRGQLRLMGEQTCDPRGVQEGELACRACQRHYPVVQGVPRLMLQDGLVPKSRSGFTYQWKKRQFGRAERRTVMYGYEIGKFMDWFVGEFTPGLSGCADGAWLLDAGCGSGEKASELARRFPQHQVVAIDQSNAIARAAWENRDLPNLYFVQANVWYPPFAEHSLQFAMSIGVLHHTPDTLRAFRAVGALVAPGGDFMTWLYPLPEEDSFWAGLYRQRDCHFLRLGHRLPHWLTIALCHLYVTALFPLVLRFLKAQYLVNKDRFPIYPDRPSLASLYRSAVFLSFDNVMPPHQFRHGRREVAAWYRAQGFGAVNDAYPGFFHAVRAMAAP
ncbi:MAG: methyltransferase domain-containing protein [Paludibacterium sp.]|uniref:methyltransferase domain-containing protein n=1 Tax=Paludibacterium sp. TaxID=1917523 RepID=UPI0025DBC0B8|nr:methyltransferase domain-containing protein [Paludibacterium sp.]MBV8049066.1 methyltransferase domain-containing protein [Paludibacterium sp.]MBV8649424.1 methyltransferase domain-containing protein [Paludibacterium sp.]